MKRRAWSTGLTGVVAVAAVMLAATPADAAVQISQGHVDVLDIDWTGSALTLDLLDYNPNPDVDRDPATVELIVKNAAKTTVPPGAQYAFLGNPGDPVWILPQSEPDATRLGVLWPGWNAHGVPSGALQGNTMTIRLVSTDPNNPGDVSAFTVGTFGTVTKLFDDGDGTPDTKPLTVNAHEHANWAFEGAGTYKVTFEVTANGGAITTGPKTYTFIVQP